VITGGGSGIGLALARRLSSQGCAVVIVGRQQASLEAAESEIRSRGGTALSIVADVRDEQAMKDVVAQSVQRFGELTYFFNNAGISLAGEMEEFTEAHWDTIININVRGVINGVMAAYPLMVKQGFGHIVNVSSFAGLCPTPLTVPYTATKHAVVGLSLALRPEAAAKGVRVSVVCPGYIDTTMLDRVIVEGLPPSRLASSINFREEATRARPPYPPELLAERILTGMDKNKAVIIAPRGLHAVWAIYRMFPRLFDRLAPRNVSHIREQARAADVHRRALSTVEKSA
jgi:short-subunit dehydrogenase